MSRFKKCPICRNSYAQFNSLIEHISSEHADVIQNNGCKSALQLLFNIKYRKRNGNCVICKKETEWIESIGRYNRFCSNYCRAKYRDNFKNKMIEKYGKVHLLNEPDKQKEMLANRKISGMIQWGDKQFTYTGSYERKFILFLKDIMNWDNNDLLSPAPQLFVYKYEARDHFYIPDFYIPSINTIVEVKDGGNNPNKHHKFQNVDKVKEKIKDDVLKTQKEFNYLKITNNNFTQFTDYLENYKEFIDSTDVVKESTSLIVINEDNIDKLLIKNIRNRILEE